MSTPSAPDPSAAVPGPGPAGGPADGPGLADGPVAIEVEGLGKRYPVSPGDPGPPGGVRALEGVSFRVRAGRTLGVVGPNGAGKTTLLRVLAGALAPGEGRVEVRGTSVGLLELGAGFDDALTGRENVRLYGTFLGVPRRLVEARMDEIARFAGLVEVMDRPFLTYSTGMKLRLSFATALLKDPDVLLVDEVIAVGDEEFQTRSFRRIEDLKEEGRTVVLVSHSMEMVRGFCDEALYLEEGRVVCHGAPDEVVATYLTRVWGRDRERVLAGARERGAELRELEERLRALDAQVDEGRWRPLGPRKRRERSERAGLREAVRGLRDELDERFARALAHLDATHALGREASLAGALDVEDLPRLGELLDEASRFYADPSRVEDVLSRWRTVGYREVEGAQHREEPATEALARGFLLAALRREVEVRQAGPARRRAVIELLEALHGAYGADPLAAAGAVEEMIDVVADEVLADGSGRGRPVEGRFRDRGALMLEGVVHDLFREPAAALEPVRERVLDRWLERLGPALEPPFRSVHPRWMVERIREHLASASLAATAAERAGIEAHLRRVEDALLAAVGDPGASAGAVAIRSVRFLDRRGAPVEVVRSGEPVVVELVIHAREPVDDPMIGFGVHEPGGLLLAGPNTSTAGLSLGRVEGTVTVRLHLEAVPFTPGVYPVSVSAMDRVGERILDYHDRRYALRVEGGGDPGLLGRVRLAARWEVDRADPGRRDGGSGDGAGEGHEAER